jgi:hypothetical protein
MRHSRLSATLLSVAGCILCFSLASMVSSCDQGEQPVQVPMAATYSSSQISAGIEVTLDIKPGSCPNPINTRARGVLPVAIAGTADFDVSQIDVSTLKLEGVPPLRWAMRDVTAPYDGELQDCYSCAMADSDGYVDLALKFLNQDIVAAMDSVGENECRTLTLTGALLDGTSLTGMDIVKIIRKAPKPDKGVAAVD